MTDYNFPEPRDENGAKVDMEAIRRSRWYAVVDDTIGGYAVSNVDKPVSEHDWRKGQIGVACFMDRQDAEHIAELHNEWLARQQSGN